MFLLKKLFQLRDHTHQDEEKPFLEHLEDLRVVITRVVLTLVIAMAVCFVFRNELMEIIRRPVEQVWQISQNDKIPDGPVKLDLSTWEMAKKAERDTSAFTPEQRDHYYRLLDPSGDKNLKFHTESVVYYRAAIDMENTNGKGIEFLEGLPNISDDLRKQLMALMEEGKRPDAAVDARGKLVLMQALNPTEGFMLSIKLSLFAGIVISFPLLLLFILQFILPGLKSNEKRAMWPAMLIGFGLFIGGVLFSYFFVLPKVLDFFYNYSQEMGVTNEWRIGYYISFATQFTLIFGLGFELPVVVMTMVKLGILNYEIMKNTRSYAILAIVVIAAIITPTPDAFTLLLLAGPMVILYEICIWLAFFHRRKEREQELAEQEELRKKLLAAPPLTAAYGEDDDYDSYDEHDDHGHSPDEHFDHHDDELDMDEQMEIYRRDHEDFFDHDEDEGEESDDGTYDFDESELEPDYDPGPYLETDKPKPESSDAEDSASSDDDEDDDDDDYRKHDGSNEEER